MTWRFWVALLPLVLLAVGVNALAVSNLGGTSARVRSAARSVAPAPARRPHAPQPSTVQPGTAQPVVLGDGKDPQPDTADYTTIITERDVLEHDADALLTTIGSCERTVPDPYGTGLTLLDQCLSIPVRRNIMRARVEPPMLLGALRNMRSGACMELTSAMVGALGALGGAAYAWSGDVENPSASPGKQMRSDVRDLRLIAAGILVLTRRSGWASACRPRPYDSAEHQGSLTAKRATARLPRGTLGSLAL